MVDAYFHSIKSMKWRLDGSVYPEWKVFTISQKPSPSTIARGLMSFTMIEIMLSVYTLASWGVQSLGFFL